MEKQFRSTGWKVLLAVALVSMVGIGTALVQEDKNDGEQYVRDVEFTWVRPTTGTSVHHYVVQVERNGVITDAVHSTQTESIILPLNDGNNYRIRVAGVDANGAQGPMSDWSETYGRDFDSPVGPPPE